MKVLAGYRPPRRGSFRSRAPVLNKHNLEIGMQIANARCIYRGSPNAHPHRPGRKNAPRRRRPVKNPRPSRHPQPPANPPPPTANPPRVPSETPCITTNPCAFIAYLHLPHVLYLIILLPRWSVVINKLNVIVTYFKTVLLPLTEIISWRYFTFCILNELKYPVMNVGRCQFIP